MRHLIGSILAISVAGLAAIAATTALLNSPLRIGPASNAPASAQPGQTPTPTEIPDTPAPTGTSAPAATDPAAAKPPEGENPEESDQDPYEGIAPEDLPPDLQYDADASVSFPTNT